MPDTLSKACKQAEMAYCCIEAQKDHYIQMISETIQLLFSACGLNMKEDVSDENNKRGMLKIYKPAREPLETFIIAFFPYDKKGKLWESPLERHRIHTNDAENLESEVKRIASFYQPASRKPTD